MSLVGPILLRLAVTHLLWAWETTHLLGTPTTTSSEATNGTSEIRSRESWPHVSIHVRWMLIASLVLLLASCRACSGPESRPTQEQPQKARDELPRIPPREPGDTLSTFRLQNGFRMELIAHEPAVTG